MIISRKRFKEELEEYRLRRKVEEETADALWKLKDDVRRLQFKVDELEHHIAPNGYAPVGCGNNSETNG